MKISAKGVAAIKLFIDLGEHAEEGFISLIDISKRKEVSKKFLEQIVPLYKNAGLLVGKGGNQGGYRLAKLPHEISLKDILFYSESLFSPLSSDNALLNEIFGELDKKTEDYLSSILLDDLVERQKEYYANSWSI